MNTDSFWNRFKSNTQKIDFESEHVIAMPPNNDFWGDGAFYI